MAMVCAAAGSIHNESKGKSFLNTNPPERSAEYSTQAQEKKGVGERIYAQRERRPVYSRSAASFCRDSLPPISLSSKRMPLGMFSHGMVSSVPPAASV